MDDERRYALEKFRSAVTSLEKGILSAADDLGKDGVIQRFEFTFELLWKSLKMFLGWEGIVCSTPKDCLKAAFRAGILEAEEPFLDMLEDRNKSSHIYQQEESEKIFERIKTTYLPGFIRVVKKLESRIIHG